MSTVCGKDKKTIFLFRVFFPEAQAHLCFFCIPHFFALCESRLFFVGLHKYALCFVYSVFYLLLYRLFFS
jgi:hypothetical protein